MRKIQDAQVKGKRVWIRCDFNVPLDDGGNITSESRIQRTLPTIRWVLQNGGKAVLASHLGRPKGKRSEKDSLKTVAKRLSELLETDVPLAADCVGEETEKAVSRLKEGEVLLLENLRFHAGEEKNDPDFAKQLAKNADLYVNDAFGASHRSHASIVGVPEQVPAFAGRLLQEEVEFLGGAIHNPRRPFVGVLGGAKVSDKVKVVESLLEKVDVLLVGGAMAYTFLSGQCQPVGRSKVEEEMRVQALRILTRSRERGVELLLPVDHVTVTELKEGAQGKIEELISDGRMAVDIGPQTRSEYADVLREARTVFWNGPMGVFEISPFDEGTLAIARGMAEAQGTTIVGGGDSAAAVEKLGLADRMTHVSTGGGAALEFVCGDKLPGIAILEKQGGAAGA